MTTPHNVTVRHFVGLDLGQVCDFTALAVLERPIVHPTDPPQRRRPAYALRHLERFPPGTSYPAIAKTVQSLLGRAPLSDPLLVVDQTGVGQAVVQMLADGLHGRVDCLFCPLTLTTGHELTHGESGGLHLPKKELVGTLQILFQSRRLHVARTLSDAATLVGELENFRTKITLARTDTLEAWREGQHDDLVLAVALAACAGERALPPLHDPRQGTS